MTMHVACKRNICAKSRPSFDARRNNGVEGGIVGHCLSAAQSDRSRYSLYTESEMFVCILLARVAQSHKSELDRAAQNK